MLTFVHAVSSESQAVKGCGSSEEDLALKPAVQARLPIRNNRASPTFAHTDKERQEDLKEELKERALERAEEKLQEEREKAHIRN